MQHGTTPLVAFRSPETPMPDPTTDGEHAEAVVQLAPLGEAGSPRRRGASGSASISSCRHIAARRGGEVGIDAGAAGDQHGAAEPGALRLARAAHAAGR